MRSAAVVSFVFLAGILLISPAAALRAQSTKVELSGRVRDPAGLPVQGAEVRLVNPQTGMEQSTATDGDGRYHFFALRPATYSITATKPGFAASRREGVVLRVGDQVSVDLALQIGKVTESVNVTGAAPLLQSS